MFEAPRPARTAAIGTADVAIGVPPGDGIDYQRILSVLWRGKTTILATVAASLLIAVLFVVLVPHRYTAVTQILIDPTDLRAVSNDLSPPNQASDASVLQVESQVRVLMSDSVLRRVVKTEGLENDPEFVGSHAGDAAAALNKLKRIVQVKRAERTYVVDVSVTAREPTKAARIANAVAQAYLAEQTEVRSDAARQVSQSLTARLNDLKDRVRHAEDRIEEYKARNNILGSSGQLVNEQQLTEMNNQLTLARARTAAAKARLDQVRQVQLSRDAVGAFPEAIQSQTITALRSQYAEVMRREAEQTTSLGSRHPAILEIQAEAERLRHVINDEVNRIALTARTEYDSARDNQATIAADVEKLKSRAVTTNEAMVALRELDRDLQANRAVYESFLVRARETGEQERIDTKNIRVISPAGLPLWRSFPPSNRLLALAALVFGIAAGAGIVLAREAFGAAAPRGTRAAGGKLANTIRGYLPTGRRSSIPILAVLPDVDVSFGLSAAEDPRSRFAMELRKVQEAVLSGGKANGNSSILVVAADDDDGTVAVSLMLAAVAAVKQRVLLIDADLERRTLSSIDADQTEAGLVDVAIGRRDLSDVIVRDRETNIDLVPFVSPSSRRDRRIDEDDLKEAFDLTKRFDTVIVAAVDLSRNPSTDFFAGLVDHIVLVTRADGRSAGAVAGFVSHLGADARKIRGAVLTEGEQSGQPRRGDVL